MSKRKRNQTKIAGQVGLGLSKSTEAAKLDYSSKADELNNSGETGWLSYLKFHWWTVGLIALLGLGTLGAGLKYLEKDANRQLAQRSGSSPLNQPKENWLNNVNPFLPNPSPTPTPQLSKELIYAGDRLLTVEDANATVVPPADLAVWRRDTINNTGTWMVMGGQGSQQTFFSWGNASDKPVPGDYDGDSKTDFSVFRPSTSEWYVVKSSSNIGEWFGLAFGTTNDLPAPADYDGDGKTDIAVFRPSNGTWYILKSSDAGLLAPAFGLSTDKPAAADYDGDGKADVSVWRDTDKKFYSLRSSDGTLQIATFTQNSTEPVSTDYDGDGKADFAIRNGADWIILNSSTGQLQTIAWQQSGDKAVQNDYDGDGKADIAVWRNSNGNWYIRKSSDGQLRQEAWGTSGDIPVPAYYRR